MNLMGIDMGTTSVKTAVFNTARIFLVRIQYILRGFFRLHCRTCPELALAVSEVRLWRCGDKCCNFSIRLRLPIMVSGGIL